MDHLYRELAPISAQAWEQIEAEARLTLHRTLAGRQLFDFSGPHGWDFSATGLGRTRPVQVPFNGVQAELRRTRPLVELRVPFRLRRSELDAAPRGAQDVDLDPLTEAARIAALAEDKALFEGAPEAEIVGIFNSEQVTSLPLSDDYEKYPEIVATALTMLRNRGIDGPYSIALGPRCYEGLTETTNRGGYPVINMVRQQLDGQMVWAPAVDGAMVLSTRGGDFEIIVGQDFSIGYLEHDAEFVSLYFLESFTFLAHRPEAAVPLRYETPAKRRRTTAV